MPMKPRSNIWTSRRPAPRGRLFGPVVSTLLDCLGLLILGFLAYWLGGGAL